MISEHQYKNFPNRFMYGEPESIKISRDSFVNNLARQNVEKNRHQMKNCLCLHKCLQNILA